MTEVVYEVPEKGEARSASDGKVKTALTKLKETVNGKIGQANFEANAAVAGKWYAPKVIANEETRTNTAYGVMTTADEITGIVLPENGLIFISYHAEWKRVGAGEPSAAIFLGANQLKIFTGAGANGGQEAIGVQEAGKWAHLLSTEAGIYSTSGTSVEASPEVTTGQILATQNGAVGASTWRKGVSSSSWFPEFTNTGGPIMVSAAAGTYAISVQFKVPSSSVAVKNRKLRVWVIGS